MNDARADYLSLRLSDDALKKIVKAVGAKHIPPSFELNALAFDLSTARGVYRDIEKDNKRRARALQRELSRVSALARKLGALVEQEDIFEELLVPGQDEIKQNYFGLGLQPTGRRTITADSSEIAFKLFDQENALKRAQAGLQFLELRAAGRLKEEYSRLSPQFILMAEWLPTIFESNFGRKFGRSRSKGQELIGPGIRFIRAVLDQMEVRQANGEPYAPETIARYVSEARKRRPA